MGTFFRLYQMSYSEYFTKGILANAILTKEIKHSTYFYFQHTTAKTSKLVSSMPSSVERKKKNWKNACFV